MIEQVACDPDGLAGLRAARAHARAAAWRSGAHVDGLLVVDGDGTLVAAHSDKQGAAGTDKGGFGVYPGGFGVYPLVCFLDRGDGTGEALSGILRPGNAGSNTAQAHIEAIDLALAQLPKPARDQPTNASAPLSWRSPPPPGCPPSTARARRAGVPRSPSCTP